MLSLFRRPVTPQSAGAVFSPAVVCISHLKHLEWPGVRLGTTLCWSCHCPGHVPRLLSPGKGPAMGQQDTTVKPRFCLGRTKLKIHYMQFSGWVFCTTNETNEHIGLVLNCWSHQIHLLSGTGQPRRGLWGLSVPQTHGQSLLARLALGCQNAGPSTFSRCTNCGSRALPVALPPLL